MTKEEKKLGGVVIADNITKVSERFDRHGNLIERTVADGSQDKFEQIKAARKKRLGI